MISYLDVPTRIVFLIQGEGQKYFLRQAESELKKELPGALEIEIYDTDELDRSSVNSGFIKYFGTPDVFYLDIHGGLPYFKKFAPFWEEVKDKIPSFVRSGIDDENDLMRTESLLSPMLYDQIFAYQQAGGRENIKGILLLLMQKIGKASLKVPPLKIPKWDGIYGLKGGMSEEEYISRTAGEKEKVVVGILIHYHYVLQQDTRHIDALIQSVEAHGAVPFPVYTNMMPSDAGYEGLPGVIERYFKKDGKTLIHSLIVTTGHSLTALAAPGDGREYSMNSVFEALDVPVLQAMTTFFNYEQWRESLAGIDSMLLCSNVYQPEFDGQIISVPVGYSEGVMTEYGVRYQVFPITERIEKVVRLAINWGKLRIIPSAQKKVAVILHNMPPRADMIGCAYGLDTPESVYEMCRLLREKGIRMDYDLEDGQEIIRKIIEGTTNDGRFMSEDEMRKRCGAVAVPSQYSPWFEGLPQKNKEELKRDWGDAPGTFMTVDGEILIPGIQNGNLFIGLQPPRALEEKAEEAYHSTDMVCPYQYLAFYRYLEKIFGADIIVHVGTHGTIEWLPGKEIGLSEECYPDLAIGDLPHIYPYIIDVPGEGVQAKRRTAAVILDHCIPSMTESGTYGKLQGLEEQIAGYYHAKTGDKGKLPEIEREIWELAGEENLHTDLGLTEEVFMENPQAAIEKLHLWISDIKSSKIKDGLHTFGKCPEGNRFWNLVRTMAEVPNGNVPSIREGIAQLEGEDLEGLLEYPGKLRQDGKTNAMRLDELDEEGRVCFEKLAEMCSGTYIPGDAVRRIVEVLAGEGNAKRAQETEKLQECLKFVQKEIVPRLQRVTDELEYFGRAVDGRFVIPGPSGAPTRGNACILPTGRNFYTVDPTSVPSRSAWRTGKLLAEQLLDTYEKNQGKLPENIAIVVYSGETMKTCGDDIAEILWLYGVEPVWLGSTNRVIGLKPVPVEELGRPRIDVTLRISGLFRDTFPNLIERIEDAVNMVAALPESETENFVKKHVDADLKEFLEEGMEREQAFERASLRVFGCPPGNYGAGVDILVNSKKWNSTEDLGGAYLTWSSHAYSRKLHGQKAGELFARRLKNCEVTVKNVSSFESDMLDSDDFYNYHGGLVSAVKTVSGSYPRSYSSNAGDPSHVSTRSIQEETARIMRARICNPKWREGMMQHGYKGAQEFSSMTDILFGWDATSGVAEDWMYESIAREYLLDENVRSWMEDVNPFAVHAMSERLLEAVQRGMWDADEDTLEDLREIFLNIDGEMEDI